MERVYSLHIFTLVKYILVKYISRGFTLYVIAACTETSGSRYIGDILNQLSATMELKVHRALPETRLVVTIFVMNGLFSKIGILLFALFVVGCGVDAGPVRLDPACVTTSAAAPDLSAVFAEAVDERGRLVPDALARVRDRLDEQLLKMARCGPTATPDLYPTDASRWAWWFNARAAWSMKLADSAGCPRRVSPKARTRTFPIDGRIMSLKQIDSILLAEARRSGDFRLAACAPGAWVDYAPLPRKPFTEQDFSDRLDETFNRLVLDEKRFVIDVERRCVRIPPMLWDCRDMVLAGYRRRLGPCEVSLTTALRSYLERLAQRRLDDALGYTTVRQEPRMELAIPGRKIFYPGSIGRIEP